LAVGLCPDPLGELYNAPPYTLAGLRGWGKEIGLGEEREGGWKGEARER